MSRQTELEARRMTRGKCRYCGKRKPRPGRTGCQPCADAKAEAQRIRRGTIDPGRRGRKPASH